MTNWMTAAGLAFIAGGLATLISFRAMLFGGGARRATRAGTSARRRRSRDGRRRLADAFQGRQSDTDAGHGALASIGLADEEPEYEYVEAPEPDEEEPEPRREIDRSDRAYGDRVDGWVRPHYRDLDDRPPAGDYWTPVPDDLYADPEPSARGYGWPVPVERLPPVPDYEPATGFDLTPVEASEPTTLVPAWPPPAEDRRIRLPKSWAARNESPRHGRGDRPRPRPRPEPGSSYVSRHSAGPHS